MTTWRIIIWLGIIYLVLMVGIVIYGHLTFGYLSDVHPDQSLTNPPETSDWFKSYANFLDTSIIILALLLGIGTALFGAKTKNFLYGMGALFGGIFVTSLGYAVLPNLYFPGGDFSAWGYWLAFGFYLYTGSWLLTTTLSVVVTKWFSQ